MRVFISYSFKDKEKVEKLAAALKERGIDAWFDQWEINAGDDIVAAMNAGLEEAEAGVVVFSKHSKDSRWAKAETSYLTLARIEEGKVLVPVRLADDAWVPPLLRPLAYRGIDEVDAIVDALMNRKPKPATGSKKDGSSVERVLVTLQHQQDAPESIDVRVRIGGQEFAAKSFPELPRNIREGYHAFLQGFQAGIRRNPDIARRAALESSLAGLGRALTAFCLPDNAAPALLDLIEGCRVGTTIEVCFEADDPKLLGLPFEAIRLQGDRLLATSPPVVMMRRPLSLPKIEYQPLPGPIKILVAIGAPDEDVVQSAVLDQERELQNILDATEKAQRNDNAQVRILEVGHPSVIAEAFGRDALPCPAHFLPRYAR